MKAVEYLRQIERIETRISNIQYDIASLRDMAMGITVSTEGERIKSSGDLQRMATAVDRWVDKEEEMNAEIDRLVDLKLEISNTINQLERAKESGVLHKLYVQQKTFKDVAMDYDKSVSWATTVHGRALQSLQKVLDARKV